METSRTAESGFTLIEMAIAIAVAMVVMAGVYSMQRTMVQSNKNVDQAAEMHQNIRAGLYSLTHELRLVGADPTGRAYNGTIAIPFIVAGDDKVRFSMDIDDTSGSTGLADGLLDADGEIIAYELSDADGDGDTDLVRGGDSNGTVIIAENIDALDFIYLDKEGAEAVTAGEIQSVQVTAVGRTGHVTPFQAVTDDAVYTNMQNEVIYDPGPNDHYRRIRLAVEVVCRNMGLD